MTSLNNDKQKKITINEENFCFYPFVQVLLQPTGVVSPCCWNQDYVYGVIPEQSLKDIWNSDQAQRLREEFLLNNPQSCARQMRHIGCHKWSKRDYSNSLEFQPFQTSWPKRFDVRLNGLCNLQCIMCEVWKQPNHVYDSSEFWTRGPTEIFPYLKEMDVLGGEPFVQADTYKLIDAISAVNPKCEWSFVTNGNYRVSSAIQSRLNKIEIRWLQISVDSLDPVIYQKIRKKGDIARVLTTVDYLLRFRRRRIFEGRPFELIASACIQKLNWMEIPIFLEFCAKRNLTPSLQFAYQPSDISLLSLPKQDLNTIQQFLLRTAETYGKEVLNPILLPVEESVIQANVEIGTHSNF